MSAVHAEMTEGDPVVHDVHWDIQYKVRLGQAWSRFMRGLQNCELWASRCASCARTYVPPQSYCEACYAKIDEWTQLEPKGVLHTATIVYEGFEGGPEAPYAVGAIQIDGTDSLLMHFIAGTDLTSPDEARARLCKGARVHAVWAEERTASITDIRAFVLDE